jgi:nitrite transporter NirC
MSEPIERTIDLMAESAVEKVTLQKSSALRHFVLSVLAGMYVGLAIAFIYMIGGSISVAAPSLSKIPMGACFGVSLTLVIFARAELFTGCTMSLPLGIMREKVGVKDLVTNWLLTWAGNLCGAIVLAALVVHSGVLNSDPLQSFFLSIAAKKMHLPPHEIFLRGILANWCVCLAIWMSGRTKSDTAKLVLIWWCLFVFITSSYEHSVANMSGMMFGLLLPHGPELSLAGYFTNLFWSTFGNIVGGAGLVAGMYALASDRKTGRS